MSLARFSESMLATNRSGTVAGQVIVDPNVTGTMTLSGTAPNSAYAIQFCPFADPNGACNTITTVTSNMAGEVSTTFTMAGHGGFAGIFQTSPSGRTVALGFASGFNVPPNGSMLQAPLVRASTILNGLGTKGMILGTGFDPLTSGSVTVGNGQTAHLEVHGAAPNVTYGVAFCRNGGGSGCSGLGGITTNGNGNGSVDFQLGMNFFVAFESTSNEGVFLIGTGTPLRIQFVSGFTIP